MPTNLRATEERNAHTSAIPRPLVKPKVREISVALCEPNLHRARSRGLPAEPVDVRDWSLASDYLEIFIPRFAR